LEYARTLNDLALLYMEQEKYEIDKKLFLEERNITEYELGKEHYSYAKSLHNIASLYQYMDIHADSVEYFYKEAIRINKNALGEVHDEVFANKVHLAVHYFTQGNYKECKRLNDEVMEQYMSYMGYYLEHLG